MPDPGKSVISKFRANSPCGCLAAASYHLRRLRAQTLHAYEEIYLYWIARSWDSQLRNRVEKVASLCEIMATFFCFYILGKFKEHFGFWWFHVTYTLEYVYMLLLCCFKSRRTQLIYVKKIYHVSCVNKISVKISRYEKYWGRE